MGPRPRTGVLRFSTSVALSPLRTESPLLPLPHQGLLPPSSLFPRMSATATPVYLSPPEAWSPAQAVGLSGRAPGLLFWAPPSAPIFAWGP